jgi:tRNA G10  N-methylase Trm11
MSMSTALSSLSLQDSSMHEYWSLGDVGKSWRTEPKKKAPKASHSPLCYCKKKPLGEVKHYADKNQETHMVCASHTCLYDISYADYEKAKALLKEQAEWHAKSLEEKTRIKAERKATAIAKKAERQAYKATKRRRRDLSTHTPDSECRSFYHDGKCKFGLDCKFLASINDSYEFPDSYANY